MADDESIYVDAGEPALLHDGSVHTEYHTVADAKTAWDRLPPARRRSAAIETNRHVYKEQQINRLHYGPNPMAVDAAPSFVDVAPNFSAARRTMALNSGAYDVSAPSAPVAGTAPTESATEIRSIPRANTAATVEVPARGPLEMLRGIPPVARESLAASSGGLAIGRAELTLTRRQADPDSSNDLSRAQAVFAGETKRRPRGRYTLHQGIRVLERWPPDRD